MLARGVPLRRSVILLVTVVVVVLLLLLLLTLLQRRLIYFPAQGVPLIETVLPGADEVTFETDDGLTLNGWLLPAETDASPGPAAIVFNGNAGNRAYRAPLARELSRAGLSVLLLDYRGYGGNPGTPTESGLEADARAARTFLASRPEVDAERIVYLGESLGCAVAVRLAVDHPPAALVLRSPFTSLVDMGAVHYPYLPVRLLAWDRYASIGRIADVHAPLLVVVAEDDSIIPPSQSRQLFEAAHEPKRFVAISGADHNDLEMLAGERLIREVRDFLREVGVLDGSQSSLPPPR